MNFFFIKTIVTYIWLKSKHYHKKVTLMTNHTLVLSSGFVSICVYTNINLRKLPGNTRRLHGSRTNNYYHIMKF